MTTKCHNRRDGDGCHGENARHNDQGPAGELTTLHLGLIVGHCSTSIPIARHAAVEILRFELCVLVGAALAKELDRALRPVRHYAAIS